MRPPPSAEEEALWRKRFGLFALMRISGLAMMLGGIAVAFTDVFRSGGWPLVGGFIALAGLFDGVIAPRILRRSWDRK